MYNPTSTPMISSTPAGLTDDELIAVDELGNLWSRPFNLNPEGTAAARTRRAEQRLLDQFTRLCTVLPDCGDGPLVIAAALLLLADEVAK